MVMYFCLYVCMFVCRLRNLLSHSLGAAPGGERVGNRIGSDTLITLIIETETELQVSEEVGSGSEIMPSNLRTDRSKVHITGPQSFDGLVAPSGECE